MKFSWFVVLRFYDENNEIIAYEWFGMEEDLYQAEDQAALCLLAECPKAHSIGTEYVYTLDEDKFRLWKAIDEIEKEVN